MGIFAKLFKKNSEGTSSKNVEDFVSLTRVYFQSVIAANLGITNIRFVPDVANFKRLFKIPTQGGRLGQAEKTASRKMLMQDYGLSENFFKEIDASVKKHCRTQNDVQAYLFMYQGFSQVFPIQRLLESVILQKDLASQCFARSCFSYLSFSIPPLIRESAIR